MTSDLFQQKSRNVQHKILTNNKDNGIQYIIINIVQNCVSKDVVQDYYKKSGSYRLNFYTTNYVINPEAVKDEYAQMFVSEDLNFIF